MLYIKRGGLPQVVSEANGGIRGEIVPHPSTTIFHLGGGVVDQELAWRLRRKRYFAR